MLQILLIKLQELSMVWKPSVLMVLPENLYMMLLGQLWLPGSYMLPRLGGDSSPYVAERDRIQSVIKKAQLNFPDFSSLVDALETNLFNSILHNPNHVLHQLMPAEKINSHNLRERSHNFTIPLIVNKMLRKIFLYRLLFRDMY